MSKKFENLIAWQSAKDLSLFVYKLTDNYPKSEQFALTSQTTRAAVSIIANIAEGSSRSSKRDFAHFLDISLGSAFELETLIIIAYERKYLTKENNTRFEDLITTTEKLVNGLKRSLF